MKIAFLCLPNLESFLTPITRHFQKNHEIKTVFNGNIADTVHVVKWADVIWVEWGNEMVVGITTNPELVPHLDGKRVIVRIHSYEILTGFHLHTDWSKVDDIIFVAEHCRDYWDELTGLTKKIPCHYIPNGVPTDHYTLFDKQGDLKSFAFVGYISNKKGVELLLHAFEAVLHEWPESRLCIAGKWQDDRYRHYLANFIRETGINDYIKFDGWQENMKEWYKDKGQIICSSPWESQNLSVMQAMSMGIRPLVHNFPGAKKVYKPEYVWTTIPEFVKMATAGFSDPEQYRNFIVNNYRENDMMKKLEDVVRPLDELPAKNKPPKVTPTIKSSKVGCVIAVKNGADTIDSTIESLLKQSRPLNHIVIVDDGSTDDTADVINAWAKKNPNVISVISCPQTRWVVGARNLGAKAILPLVDYIFFMDADDQITEDYVKVLTEDMKLDDDLAVAYTDMIYIQGDERKEVTIPDFDNINLLAHNYIHYGAMMRAKDFKDIGGYSEYLGDSRNHCYDHHLWLKYAITKKMKMAKVSGPAFIYNNDQGISKNYERPRYDMEVQMLTELGPGHVNPKKYFSVNDKRILLVCWGQDYIDRSKFSWEPYTFIKPLEEFGNVYTFFWDIELKHYHQKKMLSRLWDKARQIKPDLIFHIAYKHDIPQDWWMKFSAEYNTCVWFADDNWRLDDYSLKYGRGFRHVITTYPEAYEVHKKDSNGCKETVHLSQWAANQHYFKDYGLDRSIDISFLGQDYGDRAEMMESVKKDYPISDSWEVFWGGRGSWEGNLDYVDMCKTIANSKISLNFAKGSDGKLQLKCRPFEVCATGALLITERCDNLEYYFEEGQEVICFDSKGELLEKIEYYIMNDEERKTIAKAGQERVLRNHTWGKRLGPIFKEIML